MTLVQLNWNPEDRQLKQFGVFALILLPLAVWIWGGTFLLIGIGAALGAVLTLLGFLAPRALKPVFLGISLILMPLGIVVGEVLLLLVFLTVFVPMGIIFRLIGRDRLQLKFDRNCKSYWQDKQLPTSPARYFRQY